MTASLEITGPALAAIEGHLRDLREGSPNEDWVPALIWGPRGVKMDGEQEWSDLGVGFSLGFYTRDQLEAIPPEAIATHGDLEVVVMNSSPEPNAFEGKKVILDDKQFILAD